MADDSTTDQLRNELRDLDAEIAQLRASTRDLRAEAGSQAGGVEDTEEQASDLTTEGENDAVLDVLEQRRATLRRQLGEAG
jgi:chromosome segregation ATPase